MDLQTKTAIVIGGAGGIGKAICDSLSQRGIKKLAVIDMVDEDKGKSLFKNAVIYKKGSVTDQVALETIMTSLKSEMGGLDIVINSAGVLNEQNPKLMIEINYGGVVNSTLTAIKLMRKDHSGNGGFIINIASLAGLNASFCLPIYSGTKHAVLGFTRSFFNKTFYEKTGLKFMTICPGLTETPMATPENFLAGHLFQDMLDEVMRMLGPHPKQGADAVGKCILSALDDGENGAVWQVENNRSEKVVLKHFPLFD